MINLLPVNKVVVEWRYDPQLQFYGKMDQLGLDRLGDFPDWQRSPLSLEIRDKKKHRRAFFSFNRSFFESDEPSESNRAVEWGREILQATVHHLGLSSLKRVGIRQWFAVDLEKSFIALVDIVHSRFSARNEQLAAIIPGLVRDISYVVDFEHEKGWKYNLRLGPMEKEQWLNLVPYEQGLFETDEEGRTFKKFCDSLPAQFIYLDIDCYQLDIAVTDVAGFVIEASAHARSAAQGLVGLCRESE